MYRQTNEFGTHTRLMAHSFGQPRLRKSRGGIIGVMTDVTQILSQIESGDPSAAEQLLPLVYEELRKLAAHRAGQRKTWPNTAGHVRWCMRPIYSLWAARLPDHIATADISSRQRPPRCGKYLSITRAGSGRKNGVAAINESDCTTLAGPLPDDELLALDEALQRLAAEDPLKAQLVELRYFAGLTGEQAAEVLGISASSADRQWAFARAWLQAEVRGS